jgi:hypothetical protein
MALKITTQQADEIERFLLSLEQGMSQPGGGFGAAAASPVQAPAPRPGGLVGGAVRDLADEFATWQLPERQDKVTYGDQIKDAWSRDYFGDEALGVVTQTRSDLATQIRELEMYGDRTHENLARINDLKDRLRLEQNAVEEIQNDPRQAWRDASGFGLPIPFEPGMFEPRDVGLGVPSTEFLSTGPSYRPGEFMVYPRIWWDPKTGDPIVLDDETARGLAYTYEDTFGREFPSFTSKEEADTFAMSRAEQGGALQAPLYTIRGETVDDTNRTGALLREFGSQAGQTIAGAVKGAATMANDAAWTAIDGHIADAAILNDRLQRKQQQIDAAADDPELQKTLIAERDDLERQLKERRDILERSLSDKPEARPEDMPLYQKGQMLQEAITDLLPSDPRIQRRTSGKVAGGMGSMVGFMIPTIFTGVAGGAATGAAVSADEMYNRAIAEGLSPDEARKVARFGALVGTTEVLPIATFLGKLPSPMRTTVGTAIFQRLANAGSESLEEGLQEGFSSIMKNLIDQKMINEDRELLDGVTEDALIGAISGGLIGGLSARSADQRIAAGGQAIEAVRADIRAKIADMRAQDQMREASLTPGDRASPIPDDVLKETLPEVRGMPNAAPRPGGLTLRPSSGAPVGSGVAISPEPTAIQTNLPGGEGAPGAERQAAALPEQPSPDDMVYLEGIDDTTKQPTGVFHAVPRSEIPGAAEAATQTPAQEAPVTAGTAPEAPSQPALPEEPTAAPEPAERPSEVRTQEQPAGEAGFEPYIETTPETQVIPIDQLTPLRARPEGIDRARTYMDEAARGDRAKRAPVTVRAEEDGTYTVLDGNSTYAAGKEMGWSQIPVRVVTQEQYVSETAPEFERQLNGLSVEANGEALEITGPPQAEGAAMALAKKTGIDVVFTVDPVVETRTRQAIARVADPKMKGRPLTSTDVDVRYLQTELKALQPVRSTSEASLRGIKNHNRLNSAAGEAAQKIGVSFQPAPVKKIEKIRKKVDEKYNGNARSIADVARTGVTVDTPQQADTFISELSKRFHVIDEGWAATPAGYFDRKAMVVFDDQQLGEIQIWPPGMLEAKEMPRADGGPSGHDLYNQWQSKGTPEEVREQLRAQMEDLYGSVLSQLSGDWNGVKPSGNASGSSGSVPSDTSVARASSSDSQRVPSSPVIGRASNGLDQPLSGPSQSEASPRSSEITATSPKSNVTTYMPSSNNGVDTVASEGADVNADRVVEERELAAAEYISEPLEVEPSKGKQVRVNDVARTFDEAHQEIYGRKLFPEESEADYQTVLAKAVAETNLQLQRANSGVGWYSKDIDEAFRIMSEVYPELGEPGTARSIYLTFAGIFSNDTDPDRAWQPAAEAYSFYRETGEIPIERRQVAEHFGRDPVMTTFKSNKTGEMVTQPANWTHRNASGPLTLTKWLVDTKGAEGAIDWLMNRHPRAEIDAAMIESGAYKTPRWGTKPKQAGPDELGYVAFGEKLGRYAYGMQTGIEVDAGDTTVDKWYVRTYRRWTGRLFDKPIDKSGVASQPNPANGQIERKTIFRLTEDISKATGIPPSDVQATLWFFEKRLYAAHGLKGVSEGTNSSGARTFIERWRAENGDAGDGGDGAGVSPDMATEDVQAGQRAAPVEERDLRSAEGRRTEAAVALGRETYPTGWLAERGVTEITPEQGQQISINAARMAGLPVGEAQSSQGGWSDPAQPGGVATEPSSLIDIIHATPEELTRYAALMGHMGGQHSVMTVRDAEAGNGNATLVTVETDAPANEVFSVANGVDPEAFGGFSAADGRVMMMVPKGAGKADAIERFARALGEKGYEFEARQEEIDWAFVGAETDESGQGYLASLERAGAGREEAQDLLRAARGISERIFGLEAGPVSEAAEAPYVIPPPRMDEASWKLLYPILRKELDKQFMKNVRLGPDPKGWKRQGATRRYHSGAIDIVIGNSIDPMRTLHHESVHAARMMGAFTAEEWEAVAREAMRSWINQYDIVNRYPTLSISQQIEEAVAEAYADWAAGRIRPEGMIARAFAKLKRLLEAFRRALTGSGYTTAEDVFGRLWAGEVARRTPGNTASGFEDVQQEIDQVAHHGSPYRFDRFDISRIGTGEGAQAFGWGLYAAQARGVAQQYTMGAEFANGVDKTPFHILTTSPAQEVVEANSHSIAMRILGFDEEIYTDLVRGRADPAYQEQWDATVGVVQDIQDRRIRRDEVTSRSFRDTIIQTVMMRHDGLSEDAVKDALRRLDDALVDIDVVEGVYTVELPDSDMMASWDDPMSAQPDAVLEAVEPLWEQQSVDIEAALQEALVQLPKVVSELKEAQINLNEAVARAERDLDIERVQNAIYKTREALEQIGVDDRAMMTIDEAIGEIETALFYSRDYSVTSRNLYDVTIWPAFQRWSSGMSNGDIRSSDVTFQRFYENLADELGSDQAASEALRDAGIPGHRFLDGFSRRRRDGTYNFVIYDDNAMRILELEQRFDEPSVADLRDMRFKMAKDRDAGRLTYSKGFKRDIKYANSDIARNWELVSDQEYYIDAIDTKLAEMRRPAPVEERAQVRPMPTPAQGTQRMTASQYRNAAGSVHLPDRASWATAYAANQSVLSRIAAGKEALRDAWIHARHVMQDRMIYQKLAEEEMRATGFLIDDTNSVYSADLRMPGLIGKDLSYAETRFKSPITSLIADANSDGGLVLRDPDMVAQGLPAETYGADAAALYIYAMHALERNARIRSIRDSMPDGGSGMSDETAQAIIDEAHASAHADKFRTISRIFDEMNNWKIERMVETGLLSREEADLWRAAYKHWAPMRGFEEEFNAAEADFRTFRSGMARGPFSISGKESRRALGRKTRAANPLSVAFSLVDESIVRGEKNRVGQYLIKLAEEHPQPQLWEVRYPDQRPYFNERTGLVEMRTNPVSPRPAYNELGVKVDGKEVIIRFKDERLASAMAGVGTMQMNKFFIWNAKFSRFFSMMNTMLSPAFVIRNAIRDFTTAEINLAAFAGADATAIQKAAMSNWTSAWGAAHRGTKKGGDFSTAKDVQTYIDQGRIDELTMDDFYAEYESTGARVAFWKVETPMEMYSDINRMVGFKSGSKAAQTAKRMLSMDPEWNPVLHFIENVNLATDNAIRVAVYAEARKRGWTREKAASMSKDLTVNFNRRGSASANMNALYPFFNAAVQGTQTLFRAAHSKKVQAIMLGGVMAGFLNDMLNAGLSDEDDDGELQWDKTQEWVRERNFIIYIPGTEPVAIPMPYGYSVFPYIGQQISRWARGIDGIDEVIGNVTRASMTNFSPLTGGDLVNVVLPTWGDLIYELTTNKNWLGSPIRPENPYGDYGPQSQLYYNGASPMARAAAEGLNALTGGNALQPGLLDFSPEYFDHVAGFFGGGAGRFTLQTADLVEKVAQGRFEELTSRSFPIYKDFRVNYSIWQDQDRFYEFRELVRDANAMKKRAVENGWDFRDFMSPDQVALSGLYQAQLDANRALKPLRDRRDTIQQSDMSEAEKWRLLQPVEEAMRKLYLDFNGKVVKAIGPQGSVR